MTLPNDVASRARRLALNNALTHEGTALPDPIVSRLLATDPTLRSAAVELRELVGRVVAEVSGLSDEAKSEALRALGGPEPERARSPQSASGDFPELMGAVSGKVVLRMAPFPSGALHLGNARMIYINDYYRQKYNGKVLLVFDDTVGSEEKRIDVDLFDVILGDLELAGAKPDAVYYKSDRVPLFYPWARRLIDRHAAYVCTCPALRLRENRAAGVACAERSQTLEETLELWEKMLGGGFEPGEAVLRLKTDLRDPDPAFRDRVLLRISDFDHPRVGRRYRVWPMLEFSWAVDDVELGITHVLRGKDLVIEDRMQQFVWGVLGIQGPPFLHWGLLRVREAKISKSKSYQEVTSGQFDGWADPRTWSIRSLDRRGISREALRRFTLSFGMSLADIEVPAETLYAENRGLIDASTPRRSFVADPVRVDVDQYPDNLSSVSLPNHPDRPELGRREVRAGPSFYLAQRDLTGRVGEEIRLKDLLNLRLPEDIPAEAGVSVKAKFTSRENRRLPRLQWVGAEGALPVDVLEVDGGHRSGVGEVSLASAHPGDIYQFERVGFVRVEENWKPGDRPVRVCFGHP